MRGNKKIVDFINNLEGELHSSYVCLAELYEGIWRVKHQKQLEKTVLDFFRGLVKIYGLDENIALNFGKIRASLKRAGKLIEDLDILIAATCIAQQLTLITRNYQHFSRISDLTIINKNK